MYKFWKQKDSTKTFSLIEFDGNTKVIKLVPILKLDDDVNSSLNVEV